MRRRIGGAGVAAFVGVLAFSRVSINAAEPRAAGSASAHDAQMQKEPEVLPPGALVLRGPGAGSAKSGLAGTNSPTARAIVPTVLKLRPELAELVRLQASGVGDGVILAHIQNSPPISPISADEIVYLKDVGISPRVLTAMLQHQKQQSGPGPADTPDLQSGRATNRPPKGPMPPMDTDAEQMAAAALQEYESEGALPGPAYENPVDSGYVYADLAPYGAWMDVPDYGWSWQPTVCTMDSSWQPYCHNGRWRWSESGWYWHSRYSWGGVPFHYGRWSQHARYGWLWHPDRVWAPAWVSWRHSADYCGWAPLPPGTDFKLATGWTFHGRAIKGQQADFGLPASAFTFVAKGSFSDPSRHRLSSNQADELLKRTQPAADNGFMLEANNRIVNVGFEPQHARKATGLPIRPTAVKPGLARSAGITDVGSAGQFPSSLHHGTGRNAHTRTGAGAHLTGAFGATDTSRASSRHAAPEPPGGHVAQYPAPWSVVPSPSGPGHCGNQFPNADGHHQDSGSRNPGSPGGYGRGGGLVYPLTLVAVPAAAAVSFSMNHCGGRIGFPRGSVKAWTV